MWSCGERLADDKGAWGDLGVSDSPVICVLLMVTWICESVNRQRTIYKKGQFTITKCFSVSPTFILILNINLYIYIHICLHVYTHTCSPSVLMVE